MLEQLLPAARIPKTHRSHEPCAASPVKPSAQPGDILERTTAVQDEADRHLGERVFAIMRTRHLPPGQLSVAMLRDGLGLPQWEAQSSYEQLTQSRKPAAWPKKPLCAPCIVDDVQRMREHRRRLAALVCIVADHNEARTTLHTRLCQTRRILSAMQRASRDAPDAPSSVSAQAICDMQAELIALSRQVYAYPFAGDALAAASRRGADVHACAASTTAIAPTMPSPDDATSNGRGAAGNQ